MKKQQEFAYNSALKNIQKIGNITEIPSLQVAFSEEELNALDWFFDQLDTEQLRQYDSLNTGETIDVNSVLITARLGKILPQSPWKLKMTAPNASDRIMSSNIQSE